jgi:hypothetical protein
MTDITTRDEDQAREREIAQEKGKKKEQDEQRERDLAQEKGKKKEQDEQHERELAQEKGRKKGQEEERGRGKQKGGLGTGLTIVIAIIVIALIVALAAFLTLSVSVTNVAPGNALPYTTMYSVSFPEGQTITIGNSHISVLSYQGDLITDIDGDRQKLLNGQNRVITERRAVVNTLGGIKLVDTNFLINLTYKGDRDNQAYFDMAIRTSKQIPDILLQKLIPSEIDARPM